MRIRKTLVAVAAGGALLLLGAGPASARSETYGRYAPTYTSTPGDPTPVSKWVGSSQGEGVVNPKGEITRLRGRAAVLETFGVKRARILDVTLQRLRNGKWETAAQRTTDVVSEAPRAYAVAYTPEKPFCWSDDTLMRTYRVVQRHAIRRVDGVVTNPRVTVSKTFVAHALEADPDCKFADLTADVRGPTELTVGDRATFTVEAANPLTNEFTGANDPVDGVMAHVAFSEGLRVIPELLPEGCVAPDPSPIFNESDVACSAGHLDPGQSRTFELEVEAVDSGGVVDHWIDVFVDSSSPWGGIGEAHHGVAVLIPEPPADG